MDVVNRSNTEPLNTKSTIPINTPNPAQKFPIIPILLTFMLTSALFLGGYFTYRYFNLKSQLTTGNDNLTKSGVISNLEPNTTEVEEVNTVDNLKTYANQVLGISFKYPSDINLYEINPTFGLVVLAIKPLPPEGAPGEYYDSIRVKKGDSGTPNTFDNLFQTNDGQTYDLTDACGITTTKIKNLKFSNFDAVEYIHDGSNPPKDCGRGLIGYEHIVLIKIGDSKYIQLINGSMNPDTTRIQDKVFEQVLSSLIINASTP